MKTYKLWEVFKMLEENPRLKFRAYDSKVMLYVSGAGFIWSEWRNGLYGIDGNIEISEKWTLVEEPVDFMTAIMAYYEDNKTIKSVVDSTERRYEFRGLGLENTKQDAISATEIIKGKWYIEE